MKCSNCSGEWKAPQGMAMKQCPFCQHSLETVSDTKSLDSHESVIEKIVTDFGTDIYVENIRLISLLSDYLVKDKKTLLILRRVIEAQGARALLQLKGQSQGEFELARRALVLKLADETLIPAEIIEVGVNLLAHGLGQKFEITFGAAAESTSMAPAPKSPPLKKPVPVSQPVQKRPRGDKTWLFQLQREAHVVIPEGISAIEKDWFRGNTIIESLVIPKTVNVIAVSAFENCKNLKIVHIQAEMKHILVCTFRNCVSLKKLYLPDTLVSIESKAFAFCESLEQITVPKSLEIVSKDAFYACHKIEPMIQIELKRRQ